MTITERFKKFTILHFLERKFENVYFPGKHLADWQGFMEGAINTGKAAAEQILGSNLNISPTAA